MSPEEYGELADDLDAVVEPEPATGAFGPVLYGLVGQDETEDLDGYLRPAENDLAAMREIDDSGVDRAKSSRTS